MSRKYFEDVANQIHEINCETQIEKVKNKVAKLKRKEFVCKSVNKAIIASLAVSVLVMFASFGYAMSQASKIQNYDSKKYSSVDEYIDKEGTKTEKESFKKMNTSTSKVTMPALVSSLGIGFVLCCGSIAECVVEDKRKSLQQKGTKMEDAYYTARVFTEFSK